MKPLIDTDVLLYEIGYSGEFINEAGEHVVKSYEDVVANFDQKIKEICAEVWATEPPLLFLTNKKTLHRMANKINKRKGKPEVEYKENFRNAIAKEKEYKATRNNKKPVHFDNLTAHVINNYDYIIANGIEADDAMSIYQYSNIDKLNTIICSRDKDLRITPGMHFSWECGNQAQIGPMRVTDIGELTLDRNKIKGNGLKFFYSQLITGDTVDNIPGLPRKGPAFAYKLLSELNTERELYDAVKGAYVSVYGDGWKGHMLEQGRLLWMVREVDKDGEPVMWELIDDL